MNKVYLSGEVFDQPRMVNKPDHEAHLVFALLVKHRSKIGIRKELYRISAWGFCALFCQTNLRKDMRVALQGYLAIGEITKKWTIPIPNWGLIIGQLLIYFDHLNLRLAE